MEELISIFPELKESEDERIRKELIGFIKWSVDRHFMREDFHQAKRPAVWLAYLEKQKEQKPMCIEEDEDSNVNDETNAPTGYGKYVDECLNEASKHFFSEGEDKYSVADLFYAGVRCGKAWFEKRGENNKWKPSKNEMDALYSLSYITNKMDDKKDEAITKLYQDLKREFFNGASYENMFPKEEKQKDFQTKVEQRMEYLWDKLPDTHRVEEGNCTPEEWKTLGAYMELEMNFDKGSEEKQKEQKPSEWEPQTGDTFRKKGTTSPTYHLCDKREDGITFGFVENREIGIAGGEITVWDLKENYELVERLKSIEQVVEDIVSDAFKSIPQPKQEWSEEDERIRAKLLSYFNGFEESTSFGSREVIEIRHWLKSLRPQIKQERTGKCQEGMYDIETE